MMKTKALLVLMGLSLLIQPAARADEGMWLPFFLGKKYEEMKAMGLKLTPEQLYDINNASLKDAIVALDGGGCTGEMISPKGLLLTNHHCGYGEIQSHSTLEHDYLTDGFWAQNEGEELVNPGKTASFLVRIEDVTERVLEEITNNTSAGRNGAIRSISQKIEKEATENTHYNAEVKSMFAGNEFYLFVYETFRDVRLVGAPPSSIGKFGGDTDNWVWPRHTGDFTLFRVYMGPDGKPADYSVENVPYEPKHYLPISMKGIEKNDFTMIWGYPGSTDRYLSSYGVIQKMDQLNPATVKLRDAKMKIMKAAMDQDPKVKIQYADKIAYLGNFWKKDGEESKALRRLKVPEQKQALEQAFLSWVNADEERKETYGTVIPTFEEVYREKTEKEYSKTWWYIIETTFFQGSEILTFAFQNQQLGAMLEQESENLPAVLEETKAAAKDFYKDFHPGIDQEILATMLRYFYEETPADLHPDLFQTIEKKFKGDFDRYAEWVFKKSVFASEEAFMEFLEKPKAKKLEKDPALLAMTSIFGAFRNLSMLQADLDSRLAESKRLFIDGIRKMNDDKFYYPDANSTMRMTYGIVNGYEPRNAVSYDYITYLEGVMEKEDPSNEEFIVPERLKKLYEVKDFGRYADKNGKLPVCFITNHDITGGNSGSPVINADGELIGTAFDGNNDAMSSDIQFDHNLQRTIVCDIRYVLFVMDKYANAKNLIEELDLRY